LSSAQPRKYKLARVSGTERDSQSRQNSKLLLTSGALPSGCMRWGAHAPGPKNSARVRLPHVLTNHAWTNYNQKQNHHPSRHSSRRSKLRSYSNASQSCPLRQLVKYEGQCVPCVHNFETKMCLTCSKCMKGMGFNLILVRLCYSPE